MPEIPSTSMYGSENNGNYMTSNSFGFTAIVEKTPPLNPPGKLSFLDPNQTYLFFTKTLGL